MCSACALGLCSMISRCRRASEPWQTIFRPVHHSSAHLKVRAIVLLGLEEVQPALASLILGRSREAQAARLHCHTCKSERAHSPLRALQVSVAGHGAAMVVAKVARIDLLQDQWPNLLERIHQYIAPESPDTTREHALQCLGFICEEHVDATDRFPQQETNRILTSLVSGMAQTQPDRVRLAATKALCDAIEFASFNFDKEDERNYLMQTICEVMISSDAKIRLAAYQNVNKVLEMHYRYLERYISALYGLTTSAFRDSDDEVAMQARSLILVKAVLRPCPQACHTCNIRSAVNQKTLVDAS